MGEGNPVFVIAEVGVNHNGDLELARRLVAAAADAGADAVKLQAFNADRLAAPYAPKAAYQHETTEPRESQLDMLRRLELSPDALQEVADECRSRGLQFLASAFDEVSVELLDVLEAAAIKLGSGELTNAPLLETAASVGRPVIVSTGMAELDEVVAAVDILQGAGATELALLHCVSNYPADSADANVRALTTLRDRFAVPVGFSDHTLGREAAIAAVALGASIVEKHLTLDRSLPGPDHVSSLDPKEFGAFVESIRIASAALGDGVKRPAASELENRLLVRRSLVARRDLAAGTRLDGGMLDSLRPGTGITPMRREEVIGRRLVRPLTAGEQIGWSDVE